LIHVLFSYSERNLKPEATEGEYYIVFIKLLREETQVTVMVKSIDGRKMAGVRVQKG